MKVWIGLLFIASVLVGCHSTPIDFQSPIDVPSEWTDAPNGPVLPDQWWTSLDDPSLDQLIETALDGNFSLRMAWDRLSQARAIARRDGAEISPTLDLTGGVSRTRGQDSSYTTDWDLGLIASYELDVWGRVRSTRDAALLDAMVAEEDVHAAAISLTADIASRWFEYAEQSQRIEVLERQQRNNREVLEIITAQFRAGQVRAEDVLRQQNLVESSVGDLALAQQQAETIRLQLLVLLGQSPDAALPVEEAVLINLPPLPDIGIPSVMLQQRPDVRSAYRAVQAADRRTAAAIADRYPNVSLSASIGTSANRVSDLFDNWAANLAGNLIQPLLDGGQRQAEVDRTLASTSEAINNYGQTVLTALSEVESALAQERQQMAYVQSIDRQFTIGQQVVERVRDSYLGGQSDYLNVLEAQTSVQQLELQRLEARRVLIGYRVDLSRALAGGWAATAPEPARFVEVDESENSSDDHAARDAASGDS
tara:strand:- start:3801 stop:5243 length:1443 start_codon:yes stop_codon:yes gene_type:complete